MSLSVSDDKKDFMVPEMRILRRPKSDDDQVAGDARPKKDQEKGHRKPKTLEEKQAAYEEARSRILGSDYKPDTTPTDEASISPVASRNRSPEIIVRRPSPESMFVPCYQTPPPQQYQMHPGNFVPISTQPYFYFDPSRPPPPLPPMTALHYDQPPSMTPYIPGVGTLGSAMQIVEPRHAQRKDRHKKKKNKETVE